MDMTMEGFHLAACTVDKRLPLITGKIASRNSNTVPIIPHPIHFQKHPTIRGVFTKMIFYNNRAPSDPEHIGQQRFLIFHMVKHIDGHYEIPRAVGPGQVAPI